jgi:hypothetical protein
MRCIVIIAITALAGCAHDPPPAPIEPVAVKPEPPPKVYFKPGATHEEFERTKARCMMQMDFDAPWKWAFCMRAEGWVLVPQRSPQT